VEATTPRLRMLLEIGIAMKQHDIELWNSHSSLGWGELNASRMIHSYYDYCKSVFVLSIVAHELYQHAVNAVFVSWLL